MSDQDSNQPKPATEFTARRNSAAVIDFDDGVDFAAANHGLVARHPTGRIEKNGRPVWDVAHHDFIRNDEPTPDTVHPGLWRQGKLNAVHGLFEVADGVWQARGYDLSNITFIAADSGWLIIDPLTAEECARACLELANDPPRRAAGECGDLHAQPSRPLRWNARRHLQRGRRRTATSGSSRPKASCTRPSARTCWPGRSWVVGRCTSSVRCCRSGPRARSMPGSARPFRSARRGSSHRPN